MGAFQRERGVMCAGLAAPKELVALAMVAAPGAATCPYCTAHCASFAQRRGASATLSAGTVTGACIPAQKLPTCELHFNCVFESVNVEGSTLDAAASCEDTNAGHAGTRPVEQAIEQFATALATVPHKFTPELHRNVREHLSAEHTEWVALRVAMMGYLANFMDGLGVELEPQAVNDVWKVLEPSEWQPGQHAWPFAAGELVPQEGSAPPSVVSFHQAVKVLINAPAGLSKEASMLKDVPKDAASARAMIAGTERLLVRQHL